MSKELEALRVLKANAILFDDGTDFGASMLEAISELDKYLTPPTVDEVCEALSEYFNDKVIEMETTFYLPNKDFNSRIIVLMHYDDNLNFKIDLPPHLITLIGRFYEAQQ